MTMSNYFIVSCDGGGIRGLVTAMLLEDLEAKCPGFLSQVALFAGTSTGGIIALGLAAEIPIRKIRSIYESKAAQIFEPFQPGPIALLKYVAEYVDELLDSPTLRSADQTAAGFAS